MAKKPQQSRSQAKAASKSRPAAASQPTSNSIALAPITAFSPFSPHFAILTQAIDRHRLSLYSTSPAGVSRLLVDYILPSRADDPTAQSGQCSTLCWVKFPSSPTPSFTNDSPQAKRQKKAGRTSLTTTDEPPSTATKPVIALGLQSGQVHLFDLGQAKVIRVLTDASAASNSSSANNAVTSIVSAAEGSAAKLYAIAKDGIVRVWSLSDAAAAAPSDSASSSSTTGLQPTSRVHLQSHTSSPNTLVSVSPSATHLLLANHTITRVDEASSTSKASYTSHASPMTHITWIDDEHYVSAAKMDPVLYIWKVSRSKSPLGTIELEQGEEIIRVDSRAGVIVVVGSQGFVGVYDAASLLREDAAETKGTKVIKPTSSTSSSALVDIKLDDAGGRLDLARLIKGVKLDLTSTQIKDPATSSLLSILSIPKSTSGATLLASGSDNALTAGNSALQRYSDGTATAGKQSGVNSSSAPVGADGMLVEGDSRIAAEDQDNALNKEGGGLDDERSLEDRLRGLRVVRKTTVSKRARGSDDADQQASSSSGESDQEEGSDAGSRTKTAPTTSLSLATSLSQALHSSDNSLISSLLTSANPDLIKGTVLRLSGPNAVLLLEACVTRLNASKRGPQKARGMVEWIKWTLRLHAGYLMSLPGLTSRLASLHSSLSARLNGHDRMLALQGRLELVLGQIELRADYDVVKAKIQGATARPTVMSTTHKSIGRIEKEGKVWKEDEDDSDEEEEVVGEGMDIDEDHDDEDQDDDDDDSSDDGSDDDSDSEDDDDLAALAEEEEGDVEDIGLTSRTINGSSSSSAKKAAAAKDTSSAAGDADETPSSDDEEEEGDMIRPAQRRRRPSSTQSKSNTTSTATGTRARKLDVSIATATATSSDDNEDEDEDSESDSEDEEEEDESDLMEDEEDEEDEDEDDSEAEEGGGGFLDDEAEEASEEEEEEEEEEGSSEGEA